MGILVKCGCGRVLKFRDRLAGGDGKCSSCGASVSIPMPEESLQAVKVKRCPKCRASLASGVVRCPGCGAEISPTKPAMSPGNFSSSLSPAVWIALGAALVIVVGLVVALANWMVRGRGIDAPAVESHLLPSNSFPAKTSDA